MDYQRIYNEIIDNVLLLGRIKVKGGQYFEEHHIIPTCMGGSNKKDNRVLLTAREHFICHKLLVEIYPGNKKLYHAVWMMTLKVRKERVYQVSSREYSYYKSLFSLSQSEMMIERYKDPNERKLQSERLTVIKTKPENIKLQSDKLKEFYLDPINRLGASERTHTRNSNPEWKESHSKKMIEVNSDPEYRKKKSDDMVIRHQDPVYKERHCNIMKEVASRPEFIKSISDSWAIREMVKCPHCKIESKSTSNMKRYHFENCKHKPNK